MTTTEARKIIESLADGRCPQTSQKLPTESAYQQPDVVRALFIAARALERVERIERRDQTLPEHAGRAWDVAEEQQLCDEFAAGKTVAELAQIHQRTRGAIQSRLERLGKIAPEARRHFETRV
jgi:hypothetical protein